MLIIPMTPNLLCEKFWTKVSEFNHHNRCYPTLNCNMQIASFTLFNGKNVLSASYFSSARIFLASLPNLHQPSNIFCDTLIKTSYSACRVCPLFCVFRQRKISAGLAAWISQRAISTNRSYAKRHLVCCCELDLEGVRVRYRDIAWCIHIYFWYFWDKYTQ